MTEMKATGTDNATGGNVVPIPTQRAQSDDSAASIAGLLLRLAERIDAHSTPLSRTESKRKDGKVEHRFGCPHCNAQASGVAYEGKRRVTLYCDRKCGATRMLSALGLDREAITGRPDLMSSVPPHFRRIDVTNEVEAIHAVHDAISDGVLPHVYERNGVLVNVAETAETAKVSEVNEHRLRALLSDNTFSYKTNSDGEPARALPSPTTCSTILARYEWPGVEPLRGVIHTPAIRPDGTVLQTPGYDPATGLFLAGHLSVKPIPNRPTAEDVRISLDVILNWMLTDFPWVSSASLANYVASLLTNVIRPRLTCPTPLTAITAPDRGSGKTFLAETPEILFGGRQYPWPQDDAEMRKQLTTMLRESTSPVLIFDNVPADRIIEYPSFAGLLTRSVWSDRILGQSREVEIPNDRCWFVNGTNLRFGGDLGSRSSLVDIDPKQPRPDRRTGFKIPDYLLWVRRNRANIVRALLILVRAWAADGAPKVSYPMRGFTPWAEEVGGILAYHGISGFMGNADLIDVHDEDMDTWSGFLAAWFERFGSTPKRLRELIPDDEAAYQGDSTERDWAERFPRTSKGDRYLGDKTLGRELRARKGRFYGDYVVRETTGGPSRNVAMWTVAKYESTGEGGGTAD
jgi:hypothetical protein